MRLTRESRWRELDVGNFDKGGIVASSIYLEQRHGSIIDSQVVTSIGKAMM
jgi:hypothetical protein